MRIQKDEETNFIEHIGNAIANGIDYASIKVDSLAEEVNRLIYYAVVPPNEEMDRLFEEYMDEQSGYRKDLAYNIRTRREELDDYAEQNPVKGTILRMATPIVESVADPVQMGMNLLIPGGGTLNTGGRILLNATQNSAEYLLEESLINEKNIEDFGTNEYVGLGTSAVLGGVTGYYSKELTKPLYEDLYKIKSNFEEPPLKRVVETNEKISNDVDLKAQAEITKRMETGQTQSLPKGYHNGERVLKTIKEGVVPKLEEIARKAKDTELDGKYERQYKLDRTVKKDVNVSAAYAEAMAPVYKDIELGKKQALGEITDDLRGWLTKYSNNEYDGIIPTGDIIDELQKAIPEDEFKKIIQGKSTDPRFKELSKILNPMTNEAISIKSKIEVVDKTEGYYFDTVFNKQKFETDLYDLDKYANTEQGFKNRNNFIEINMKNIGEEITLTRKKAKEYGLKGGTYKLKEHPELLKEFYLDINKTTKGHENTVSKGIIKDDIMTMKDVAIKWADTPKELRKKFQDLEAKQKFLENKTKIESKIKKYGGYYKELLEKEKNQELNKNEKIFKKWFEKNSQRLEELKEVKELSIEEKEFMDSYVITALDKFEGALSGYEKKPREILEDIVSTVADERSGLNTLKGEFGEYAGQPITYRNNLAKKIDKKTGFLTEMLADQDPENKFKVNVQTAIKNLSSKNDIRTRDFDQLGLADKTRYNIRNTAVYKLLFGMRYLTETFGNVGRVKSGMIDLGFKERWAYTKGAMQMIKAHKVLANDLDNILKIDLDSIKDPVGRLANEIYIRRTLENSYIFKHSNLSKFLDKGAKISAKGQLISDVHRIVMATRFTLNAMKDQFTEMTFDKLTPMMKNLLVANGIDDDIKLKGLQDQIKSFKTQFDFDNFILNADIEQGGKLKSIFEQFVDINGREFEPFQKDLTSIEANNFISKLWVDSNLLFRRYSMGAFSRAWKNVTTFYDSDGMLRYRFLKNGKLNLENPLQGLSFRSLKKTGNFMQMSALTFGLVNAVSWLHGWAFGTSQDDITEAKLEAMKTDTLPIIREGLMDTFTNYIGYDVMFGGAPAIISTIKETSGALTRAMSAENLEPIEKIMWGLGHIITPLNIGRGIDNVKFGKNIPNRLTTGSTDAQFLWKYKYKQYAQLEQLEGELPAEKLFAKISDWGKYFREHPEKAEEVTGMYIDGKESEEAIITMATGLAELTEQSMRTDHINYAFAEDDPMERENQLKEFGLDYQSQLLSLDFQDRMMLNYALSFSGITDPMYIIQAMEEVSTAKDKKRAIYSLIDRDKIEIFEQYCKTIEENPEKRKEVARQEYSETTEGYIDFLTNLRNSYY